MIFKNVLLILTAATVFSVGSPAIAQMTTTTITYQGNLESANSAATGLYDFGFRLFDAPIAGTQIGGDVTATGVNVDTGMFSVPLDFGATFDGSERWLEIEVKPSGGGAFTLLSPRQPVTFVPHATFALKSTEADTATTATIATAAINGVPSGFSILGNSETPPPGYTWSGRTVIDPVNEQWLAQADMPQSRDILHGVAIGDKFYVVDDGYTAVFNTVMNTWDGTLTPISTNRNGTCSVAAINGKIYVMGGSGDSGALTITQMYDPATDTWEDKAPMLDDSRFGGACVIGDKIYNIDPINAQSYNPDSDTWTRLESPPDFVIKNYSSVTAFNGKVYVFSDDVYIYDPAKDDGSGGQSAWSTGTSVPDIYQGTCAVVLNEKIHLLGAVGTSARNYIYDPLNDSWETGEPMLTARQRFAADVIDDRIYVTGRSYFQGSVHFLKSTERYTPEVSGYYVHIKD